MITLTVKMPPSLDAALLEASERQHLSKSELVRRAVEAYLGPRQAGANFVSALEQAGELVGCFSGGPADLSCNPRYMDDFGKP